MSNGLMLLASLWRHRKELLLPTVLGPLLAVGFALSQPPLYKASALLQIDTAKAKSPLLQSISEKGNSEALQRIIKGEELLTDTAHDAGMRVDPRRINLEVVNDSLIKIGYESPQKLGIETLVDALAYNFIYEVLAPERLRIEQRLATTGQKIQEAKKVLQPAPVVVPDAAGGAEPVVPVEPDALTKQRAQADLQVLNDAYNGLLSDLNVLNAAFDRGSSSGLMWFAEPASREPRSSYLERVGRAAVGGLLGGMILGLLLVLWRQANPRGFARPEALVSKTQVPLAGQVPDLGEVIIDKGQALVTIGAANLNPADFSEVIRLQRTLMRNLHGALVLTSAVGHEGTSLLATLLALRSAAGDKRTLLVDLNLKNGSITHSFGLEAKRWDLAERAPAPARGGKAKVAGFSLKDVIARKAGGGELDVLPMPSDRETLEYLARPGGAQVLFDGLSSTYEHIVVDTTPIAAHNRHNADPLMLAAAANRTALVVLMRRTSPTLARAAADQLASAGADVTGVIANNLHNPSARMLLNDMAHWLHGWLPGMSGWLRARMQRATDLE